MKNIITILALVLISSSLFINCENKDLVTAKQNLTPELIGQIHNEALDNILKNETTFNFNTTESEFKSQLIKENKLFLKKSIPDIKFINSPEEEESIKLLNTSELLSKNFTSNYSKTSKAFSIEESNIFDKINFMYNSKIILNDDKEILDELYQAYKKNYQGNLSNEELLNLSKSIRTRYINEHSDMSKQNVFVTLSIIGICVNSLEWFDENINTLQNRFSNKGVQQKVLFWNIVVADAIGAVVGIGLAIIEEGIRNGTNGSVNGDSIIYGALEGAVAGSVGSVIKVAGWLSKLL